MFSPGGFWLLRHHFANPAFGSNSDGGCVSLARTGWAVLGLSAFLFAFIDMVIDPVALRGDRWFLGEIYYYPDPGWHFGVPFANYCGWAVVGLISLAVYFPIDRGLPVPAVRPAASATLKIMLGIGLYYGVLAFNLAMTFWIGESFMGLSGLLMHLPVCLLLASRLLVTSRRSGDS